MVGISDVHAEFQRASRASTPLTDTSSATPGSESLSTTATDGVDVPAHNGRMSGVGSRRAKYMTPVLFQARTMAAIALIEGVALGVPEALAEFDGEHVPVGACDTFVGESVEVVGVVPSDALGVTVPLPVSVIERDDEYRPLGVGELDDTSVGVGTTDEDDVVEDDA